MGNWPAVRVKRSRVLGQVTRPSNNVQNVNLLFLFLNIIINCFSPDRVAVCNVNWNVVREISLWNTLVSLLNWFQTGIMTPALGILKQLSFIFKRQHSQWKFLTLMGWDHLHPGCLIQVTHLYCLYVTHPSSYCASIVSVRTDGASIVADWALCTGDWVLQSESNLWRGRTWICPAKIHIGWRLKNPIR